MHGTQRPTLGIVRLQSHIINPSRNTAVKECVRCCLEHIEHQFCVSVNESLGLVPPSGHNQLLLHM
jgi:hypothetical protein